MGAPVGPVTLVSWVLVGFLTFSLVREDQGPSFLPAGTSTSDPLKGGRVSSDTTTPPESSTTSRLRGPELVIRLGTGSDDCSSNPFAWLFGWLVTALGGVAVGRWTKRGPAPTQSCQPSPAEAKPRAPSSSATAASVPTRSRVATPSQGGLGGVVTPSTRRSREFSHGKVV